MRLTVEEVVKATGGRPVEARSGEAGSAAAGTDRPVARPRRARVDEAEAAAVITGVSTDTRTLRPGDLFVPLRGPARDGHEFLGEAFARGAAAALIAGPRSGASRPAVAALVRGGTGTRGRGGTRVLIEVEDPLRALADLAAYYRRTLTLQVVGITGSVGKTTTAGMCAAVLADRFRVARTRDEWNAEIGVPLTILGLRAGDDVAVIEMAMRGPGQIADLVRIAAPQTGVVTNIGEAHLELLGSLDNIARAKGELIEGLPPEGTAVLNADDERAAALRSRGPARVLTFGLSTGADVRAEEVAFTDSGMRFRLLRSDGAVGMLLRWWGTHGVRNALAAAAVAQALGVDVEAVRRGLEAWAPPKMRLQPVPLGNIVLINDAYNASPASMAAAFEVLAHVGRGRRCVAVLGEMKELGPRSGAMHRDVGAQAARAASVIIAAGGADAAALAEGAHSAAPRRAVHVVENAARAAALLAGLIRDGDVILVKGSRAMGMERVVDALLGAFPAPGSAPR